VLLGVVAAALNNPVDAFAPSSCTRRDVSPACSRCSTRAALFRWRKNKTESGGDAPSPRVEEEEDDMARPSNSRRNFLSTSVLTAAASQMPLRSYASSDKQYNLSNDDLKQIILSDIVDKSFLVSADITRSVYDESATFTDEIDVYTMDKWIKGTKSLFIASGSRVSLVGDVDVSPSEVSFRFDEDLMFNIPFKPVCALTGKVVLTRDEKTGLITSYREYWDQSVNEVLKSAKFGKKA
jgi:hypothetical protein